MRLSIIVPVVNEQACLGILLPQLRAQQGIEVEILVGDGGSTDRSREVCEAYGAESIPSDRGRGKQMNRAAQHATADMLLFLHADSELPEEGLLSAATTCFEQARRSLDSANVAGHFGLRFRRRHPGKHDWIYRFMEAKTTINRPDTINGDQGLLISRDFFQRLGGFDESMSFLEDQRISAQIFRQGHWVVLPGRILTSARRFEDDGTHRVSWLMAMIMILHSIDLKIFFDLAPKLYREQSERNALRVSSFLGLVWDIQLRRTPLREVISGWYRVGKYLLFSSWLLFFLLDILLRPLYRHEMYPLLHFRDKYFHPATNNAFFAALVGVAGHVAFCWILFPVLWVMENFVLDLDSDRSSR